MSIERIKQEAAKADQMIAELAAGKAPAVEQTDASSEAEQPVVTHDEGVAHHAATEDHAGVPAANDELERIRTDAQKWEQRYRSLDGMIQARDRQIEQLHQLLAGMQQAPAAPAAPAPTKGKLVSEKDEEAFGADLIDLTRRVMQEESGEVIAALKEQVAQLQAQLQGVSQTAAVSVQDRFETRLSAAAPNWRKIDSEPAFIEWLQASPTRHKLFAEAARAHEVQDVAYFFNEYEKTHQSAPAPAVDPRLEKQVAPGRSKAVPTPAKQPSDKKQWTRSEIADFMVNGKKRYSPDEYTRLYKDVFAAQQEGRVDFTR